VRTEVPTRSEIRHQLPKFLFACLALACEFVLGQRWRYVCVDLFARTLSFVYNGLEWINAIDLNDASLHGPSIFPSCTVEVEQGVSRCSCEACPSHWCFMSVIYSSHNPFASALSPASRVFSNKSLLYSSIAFFYQAMGIRVEVTPHLCISHKLLLSSFPWIFHVSVIYCGYNAAILEL